MAEVMPLGQAATRAAAGHGSLRVGHPWRRQAGPGFHHVLAAALGNAQAARPTAGAPAAASAIADAVAGTQQAALHLPLSAPHAARAYRSTTAIPAESDAALQQAMTLEGVPPSWRAGLQFIMAQESSGKVDAKNPVHSARGLFQLTAAHYHLNPNGVRSFGNAVEEAQGGIRYIQRRYGTADNAVAFWQQHRWY